MDYLKINGKDYRFLFALKAQREMGLTELSKKDDVFLIYLGLKYGAIVEGKEIDISEQQLVDAFEVDLDAYGRGLELLGQHLGKLKKMKGGVTQALQ